MIGASFEVFFPICHCAHVGPLSKAVTQKTFVFCVCVLFTVTALPCICRYLRIYDCKNKYCDISSNFSSENEYPQAQSLFLRDDIVYPRKPNFTTCKSGVRG